MGTSSNRAISKPLPSMNPVNLLMVIWFAPQQRWAPRRKPVTPAAK
jgi:hypothetical protein